MDVWEGDGTEEPEGRVQVEYARLVTEMQWTGGFGRELCFLNSVTSDFFVVGSSR